MRSRSGHVVLRRLTAVVSALLLAATGTVAGTTAWGAPDSVGSLVFDSVTDRGSGISEPVQGDPFDVVVQVRDLVGNPLELNKATPITLSVVSGSGVLGGKTTGTIPKNSSTGTISGATYSTFENGVVLRVDADSKAKLDPVEFTVNVSATAVGRQASPGSSLTLTDPGCRRPTEELPTCGVLELNNGASGSVTMAVGSCEGITECRQAGSVQGLLVTTVADLKDLSGDPLYTKTNPVTFILKCDKSLCGNGGVTQFPVAVDLTNAGPLELAPPCPTKGQLALDQDVCWDQVQSKRDNAGDLYSYILFDFDARASHP